MVGVQNKLKYRIMARIAKYKVEEMVKFLTKDVRSRIIEIVDEISEIVKGEYLNSIPKEVKDMFKKYPNYMNKDSCIYYNGEGLNYSYVSFDKGELVPSLTSNRLSFSITNKDNLSKLSKLQSELAYTRKDLTGLKESLSKTISTLSTEKRILTEFPELSQFFVKEGNITVLALPIADLKTQLNKYKKDDRK